MVAQPIITSNAYQIGLAIYGIISFGIVIYSLILNYKQAEVKKLMQELIDQTIIIRSILEKNYKK